MRTVFALGVALLASQDPQGSGRATLLFESATERPALDEGALADAVSIYTRDLGLNLSIERGAPETITADSLGRMVARARSIGARLLFWYEARAEAPDATSVVLYAVDMRGERPSVHAIPVGQPDAADFFRTFALKVRAVLTGTADVEPHEVIPQPALPPSTPAVADAGSIRVPETPTLPSANPAPDAGSFPGSPLIPASAPSGVSAPAGPMPPPYRPRVLFSVSYLLTFPEDLDLLRQGISLEGGWMLGNRWEVDAQVALSSPPLHTGPNGSATLFDVPLTVGGRRLWKHEVSTVAAGPFVSLHLLDVTGFGADGTVGNSLNLAAGLGAHVLLRLRASDHLGACLRLGVEQVLPNLQFTLRGATAFDAGGFQATLAAGLQFAAP